MPGQLLRILATSNPSLSTQLAQAIPFALLASVYPPAIAVLIYYLGRQSPRRLLLAYYAGAFGMTLVIGTLGILTLTGTDVNPNRHRTPSAALDMLLGIVMLAGAFVVRHRKHPREQKKASRPRKSSARGAALLGIAMYTPSLFYLSAMKLVADADPGPPAAFGSALVLTLCVLLSIEIPILTYLLFPDATDAKLKAFDASLHAHGRSLLIWGLTIGGVYMLGTGIYLATGV